MIYIQLQALHSKAEAKNDWTILAFNGHNLSCYVTCVALLLVDVLEHHHPTLADDPFFYYYTLGLQSP